MKLFRLIFFVLLTMVFCYCGNELERRDASSFSEEDLRELKFSLTPFLDSIEKKEELKNNHYRVNERRKDSLKKDKYYANYDDYSDSTYVVNVNINVEKLFTHRRRHAIIHFTTEIGIDHFNIYSITGNEVKRLCIMKRCI